MKLPVLKKRLLELREKTLAEGPSKIEPNRRDVNAVGVADEDEQALSEMMQTLASQRNKKQAEILKLIARALQRIDSHPDLVGLCEDCEEEIAAARLKLMPYATLCAGCQSKRDPKRGQARKNLTDYE